MRIFVTGVFLLATACSTETPDTIELLPATDIEPIHLISSFTAVGSSSRTARIIAPKIEEYFQRPVEIIYNEGGRGGDIGARMAAAASPDQLTLFIGTVGNVALLPNILTSYELDPLEDFRPITQLTVTPDVLIAHAGLGIHSIDELVAYGTEKEGEISYSHIAPLSIHRMEFLQLFDDLGLNGENDASIRGSAAAMDAVGLGTVDLAMTTAPYVAPLVEQGLVVPLVVANESRLPSLPDVPTMMEAGIAIPHGSWAGALVPAATSDEDVAAMFSALEIALTDPDIVAQIANLGMLAAPSDSPESFTAYIREETERLGGVARKFNVVEN
jgi:tripartite-type tricarboxylate transporter receptor subunit TctC